jgi:hypothetical protein
VWHHTLLIGRAFFVLTILAIMEQLNAASVLPAGPNFVEHVRALSGWIREVVMHGVLHGAASALDATHLRSDTDLCVVEPGFPPELLVQRAS